VRFEDEFAFARRVAHGEFVIHVVRLDETPLPERHSYAVVHDWRRGRVGSNLFDAHLSDLVRGVFGLPQLDPPVVVRSPELLSSSFGERRIHLEELLEQKTQDIFKLLNDVLHLQRENEFAYVASDRYAPHHVQAAKRQITECLTLVDQLLTMEDSPARVFRYARQACRFAALILDYDREARYMAFLIDNGDLSIDNVLLKAIATANAGRLDTSVRAFRYALRIYADMCEDASSDEGLTRFVYRVTRHLGMLVGSLIPQHSAMFTFFEKSEKRRRVDVAMDALDLAFERERVFDRDNPMHHKYYGDLLHYIGLTKRALGHYETAIALGVAEGAIGSAKLEQTREEIRTMETAVAGKGKKGFSVKGNVIQIPNFFMQFGTGPSDYESIVKERAREFYDDIIDCDELFATTIVTPESGAFGGLRKEPLGGEYE
jgi:hypothetical protein